MNKRRRAYKRYDWQSHCMQLLSDRFYKDFIRRRCEAIDIAVLYGKDALGWKEDEIVLKAGIYTVTVPIHNPYRKMVKE